MHTRSDAYTVNNLHHVATVEKYLPYLFKINWYMKEVYFTKKDVIR